MLREENIDKIIETYRNRLEEDKYSKRASLQEIATNDYNLNIPRYVDTFEAEDSIDIIRVSKNLKEIALDITQVNNRITSFCTELGIPTPF